MYYPVRRVFSCAIRHDRSIGTLATALKVPVGTCKQTDYRGKSVRSDQPHRLPDVRPTTIRLDDAMRAEVERVCGQRGISTSDYIRQAIIARLAWDYAIGAAKAGADLDALADLNLFAAMLNEYAERQKRD